MAGGLHHHPIGGTIHPPIRRAAILPAAQPDCEQAVGAETPLPTAPAACSPFASDAPPCGLCAVTPARRCCLALAASILHGAEGSKFHHLTAPIGEAI